METFETIETSPPKNPRKMKAIKSHGSVPNFPSSHQPIAPNTTIVSVNVIPRLEYLHRSDPEDPGVIGMGLGESARARDGSRNTVGRNGEAGG